MLQQMQIPMVTEALIDECLASIPISADKEYIHAFILNGQSRMAAMLDGIEPTGRPEDAPTPVM